MLFLDRDGTLMEDVGYPKDPADVRLLAGAADAVRELVAIGYVPAVVSNQSGLARGLVTEAEARAVHERFVTAFEQASGVRLPCYYCPHGPDDGCDCRKPKTGLLRRAAADLEMIGRPGVLVGDKLTDVDAAHAGGYDAILICRLPGAPPERRAGHWWAATGDWRDVADRLTQRLRYWTGATA
jgi:histidinol-phosphate phosphatase family protein